MKKGAFNYVKEILNDYPRIDDYIQKREEELRYPHKESDDNGGIQGTKTEYDKHVNMMITIEKDRRLANLERNKRIVDEVWDEADDDTQVIIKELYMRKRPNYTMQGLIESRMIYCSRTKAHELRNQFFEDIAEKLDIDY